MTENYVQKIWLVFVFTVLHFCSEHFFNHIDGKQQ